MACLIDYEKAYNRVKHEKMMNILKEFGLDIKDLRIIDNLNWNQTPCLILYGDTTKDVKIL